MTVDDCSFKVRVDMTVAYLVSLFKCLGPMTVRGLRCLPNVWEVLWMTLRLNMCMMVSLEYLTAPSCLCTGLAAC